MAPSARYLQASALVDAENAQDPNSVLHEGNRIPVELLYSQRMSERLETFQPEASELLALAVRSQHICRWRNPRQDYPMGRQGYLKWRSEQSEFHADQAAKIMEEVGYDLTSIARVRSMLRKKHLKRDADTQTLEDVACLVFLEHYFERFVAKYDEQKLLNIVRKTWAKMSEEGHRAALSLELPEACEAIVEMALGA